MLKRAGGVARPLRQPGQARLVQLIMQARPTGQRAELKAARLRANASSGRTQCCASRRTPRAGRGIALRPVAARVWGFETLTVMSGRVRRTAVALGSLYPVDIQPTPPATCRDLSQCRAGAAVRHRVTGPAIQGSEFPRAAPSAPSAFVGSRPLSRPGPGLRQRRRCPLRAVVKAGLRAVGGGGRVRQSETNSRPPPTALARSTPRLLNRRIWRDRAAGTKAALDGPRRRRPCCSMSLRSKRNAFALDAVGQDSTYQLPGQWGSTGLLAHPYRCARILLAVPQRQAWRSVAVGNAQGSSYGWCGAMRSPPATGPGGAPGPTATRNGRLMGRLACAVSVRRRFCVWKPRRRRTDSSGIESRRRQGGAPQAGGGGGGETWRSREPGSV